MYLKSLSVSGFKTFAKRTEVNFATAKGEKNGLTVIVGPNGSGKSNLADAIRWCLGEQSMKLLRGRLSEDVIFLGSEGKGRASFAEVELFFDNTGGHNAVEFSEFTITRRLYRDGNSEYLLNGKTARLQDIQLLLAEIGIGGRSYTVVGQGMIDHVLTASPEERKVFFDDATGVKALQMRRHQSLLKLESAIENMIEAERLLAEIEPRLKLLERQARRLEQRETLEVELKRIESSYYGAQWFAFDHELLVVSKNKASAREKLDAVLAKLKASDERLLTLERESATKTEPGTNRELEDAFKKAQQADREASQAVFQAERALELSKVKQTASWTPLPLARIVEELDAILKNDTLPVLQIFSLIRSLKEKLLRPKETEAEVDPTLVKALEEARQKSLSARSTLESAQTAWQASLRPTPSVNTELFAIQKTLRSLQDERYTLERNANAFAVERARIETRFEDLKREMREAKVDEATLEKTQSANLDALRSDLLRLRRQLEAIGAIDEETLSEYEATKTRFTFLSEQLTDLKSAIEKTEAIIDDLDETIKTQADTSFKHINDHFGRYFKVLFSGGHASLTKVEKTQEAGTGVTLDRAIDELIEEQTESEVALARLGKRRERLLGVEIEAVPPGKKATSLSALSGGERALTSIALLSAIMATNPSPFVVLDEVDAALDEANTVRFANILSELQTLTQFIVITHNRATMERANLLYGVTMGNDGVSNLLSVNMEDIDEAGTARR